MSQSKISSKEYLRRLQQTKATHQPVNISKQDLSKVLRERTYIWDKLSPKEREDMVNEELLHLQNPYAAFDDILERLSDLIKECCNQTELEYLKDVCIGSLYTGDPNGWVTMSPNNQPVVVIHNGLMGFAHDVSRFVASLFKVDSSKGVVIGNLPTLSEFSNCVARLMYSCLHFITDGKIPAGPHYIKLDTDLQYYIYNGLRDAIELFILGHEFGHIILRHVGELTHSRGVIDVTYYTRRHMDEYEADNWSQSKLLIIQQSLSFEGQPVPSIIRNLGGIVALSSFLMLEKINQLYPQIIRKLDIPETPCYLQESTHPPTIQRRNRIVNLLEQNEDKDMTKFIIYAFDAAFSWINDFVNSNGGKIVGVPSDVSASLWISKGEDLFKLQKYKEALTCYIHAIEVEPRNEKAWLGKAFVLMGLMRLPEANECLEHLLKLNPKNTEAWVNKATIVKTLGDKEEAIICCDRALEIDPYHRTAWYNKGMSLYMLESYKEALPCLEQAQMLGFPTAKDTVVMCRARLNQNK